MMKLSTPKTLGEAIEFASISRANEDWCWAYFLVYYLEEIVARGSSIPFSFSFYESFVSVKKDNPSFGEFLKRVKAQCADEFNENACNALHDEIWYSNSNDSFACSRGLARILTAWSLRQTNEDKRYRTEMSGVIQMPLLDKTTQLTFEDLISQFRLFVDLLGAKNSSEGPGKE